MKGGIKRGEDIILGGWKDLIKDFAEKDIPEGYSSAEEISNKLGISLSTLRHRLKMLRDTKKIECIQVISNRNNTWVYKD